MSTLYARSLEVYAHTEIFEKIGTVRLNLMVMQLHATQFEDFS